MDGADIGMVQRGNGSDLAVESFVEALRGYLDGNLAVEAGIGGAIGVETWNPPRIVTVLTTDPQPPRRRAAR